MKAWRTAAAWRTLRWVIAGCLCIGYAILANRAASASAPGFFEAAVIVSPLLVLGLLLAWRSERRTLWLALWLAAGVGLLLAGHFVAAGTRWILLLEHAGINAWLCVGFGRTLAPGAKPLISRLAEIVHGPLTPRLARYTRNATRAWAIYFGLTATASVLLFALAPPPVWSAFVTLLSVPLLAAMFAGEYLVRSLVIPRAERAGFFESVAAYRQFAQRRPKSH